jgi:hypothetical protein
MFNVYWLGQSKRLVLCVRALNCNRSTFIREGRKLQVPQALGLTRTVRARKAGNISNFLGRAPLPEAYSSISENSRIAYTNETDYQASR